MSANTQAGTRAAAAKAFAAAGEVLTLRLGAEEYGIDILRVQEIRFYEKPTRIAGALPHLLGATNLRGVIVPIVDLRSPFGLDAACGSDTVTMVLGVGGRTVGAVVDSVSDVVALTSEQIKPAPEFSGAVDPSHITATATAIDTPREGDRARMLILLDIAALTTGAEMTPGAQTTQ